MRRERHGGSDGARRVREVDGASLAVMPQVEAENDRGRQHADCGESMCREWSAVAKLTNRLQRNKKRTYSTKRRGTFCVRIESTVSLVGTK